METCLLCETKTLYILNIRIKKIKLFLIKLQLLLVRENQTKIRIRIYNGAAINAFVSTMIAVPIATYIGGFITDTAFPLFVVFFVCGCISLLLIAYLKFFKKKKDRI